MSIQASSIIFPYKSRSVSRCSTKYADQERTAQNMVQVEIIGWEEDFRYQEERRRVVEHVRRIAEDNGFCSAIIQYIPTQSSKSRRSLRSIGTC